MAGGNPKRAVRLVAIGETVLDADMSAEEVSAYRTVQKATVITQSKFIQYNMRRQASAIAAAKIFSAQNFR